MDSDEFVAQFRLLQEDPARYLEFCNRLLEENPGDESSILFSRHQAWRRLGRPDLALIDLDRSNVLKPHSIGHMARGRLHMEIGRYAEAVKDFDNAQAMAPDDWIDHHGPFFRAECHARLGNVAAAMADCADILETHYTGGPFGTPPGNKQQVTEEILRRARGAAARRG